MKLCLDILPDWNLRIYVTKILTTFLIWQTVISLASPKAVCTYMYPYYLTPGLSFACQNNTRMNCVSQCSQGTQIATPRSRLFRGGEKTAGRRRGGNGWWARKWDSSCPNQKSESVSFHCGSLKCINQRTHTHTHISNL